MYETITPNNGRTNVFVDMSSVPYLVGEYFDNSTITMIDKSIIKEGVYIDCESNPLMPYVDININHIGWKHGGRLNAFGNLIRQQQVMNFAMRNRFALNNKFDVLRAGIVIRLSYQLLNMRTRQVLRSLTEEFRINDRQYYSDFPEDDKDGLIIISNFFNQKVSQINSFTHGHDPMSLRITGVELFYEMVDRNVDCHPGGYNPNHYYDLHAKCQQVQVDGYSSLGSPSPYHNELMNPNWRLMNRLYRFEMDGREIALHTSEIYDSLARIRRLPCGELKLNHSFMINPGARIVFKFNIWKSDVAMFSDSRGMAAAIGETCIPTSPPMHNCNCNCNSGHHYPKPPLLYPPPHECPPSPEVDPGFTHPGETENPYPSPGLPCYATPQQIVAEMNHNRVYDIQQQMQIEDLMIQIKALADHVGLGMEDADKDDMDDMLDNVFPDTGNGESDVEPEVEDTEIPAEPEVEDTEIPAEPEVEEPAPEPEPDVETPDIAIPDDSDDELNE